MHTSRSVIALCAFALPILAACRDRPEGVDTKAAVTRGDPKHRRRVNAERPTEDTLTPMALQWGTDVSCDGLGPDSTLARGAVGWRVAGDTVAAPAKLGGVWLSGCHMADTDVHVHLFLPSQQGPGAAGIAFRATDSLSFYVAQIHPSTGQVSIAISQRGVIRQIGSTAIPGTSTGPWYDMRVVAIDNALEVWLEGRPVLAVGDSLLHHGATGVWAGDQSGARFAGWRAIGRRSSYGA